MSINLFLASPRGYCAWVKRAIEIVDWALKKYWTPLYVNHEIVHNKYIIKYFENKWVIFWEKPENIKDGSIIIFSAHWVWPKFIETVRKQKLRFIDASCPLVIKVHNEAKKFINEWYKIIYIWKKDHQEALWIKEEDEGKIEIVSNLSDLESIKNSFEKDQKLALLTQTTLSVDETKSLIESIKNTFTNIVLPLSSDICYATTNRQEAIKKLCEKVDILFIVGSKNSSNSVKLKEIWEKKKIPSFLIDSYKEIEENIFEGILKEKWNINIWISGWASAPEKLVQEVINYFKSIWCKKIEEIKTTEEKISFWNKIELMI